MDHHIALRNDAHSEMHLRHVAAEAAVAPFTARALRRHSTTELTNYQRHAMPETMRREVKALTNAAEKSTRTVPAQLKQLG